jgi:hypothetical protein
VLAVDLGGNPQDPAVIAVQRSAVPSAHNFRPGHADTGMVATDPYGTDVLLTDDGDFGHAGRAARAAQRADELRAGAGHAAAHLPGELPLHPDYGNALAKIIGTKANDPRWS